jgi:choline kinase
MKILITCSGVGSRMGNYTKYTNKTLIKVGDKYIIDYIIDLFTNIINVEFVVTLGYYGNFVKEYLLLAYPNHNFNFVNVDKYEGEGSSQGYSLLQARKLLQEPFIFIACDVIIKDKLFPNDNYTITKNKMYVSKKEDTTHYSSIKCSNNFITSFHDKCELNTDFVYTGITEIFDYDIFWNYLEKLYNKNKNNKTIGDIDVYKIMLNFKQFYFKEVNYWYDGGNIDIFGKKIHKNKNFNVLTKVDESITFLEDKVIKHFYNSEKNKKRVYRAKYFKNISPIIIDKGNNFFSMEKINSKPSSEYYDQNMIEKILKWAKKNIWFPLQKTEDFKETVYKFYYEKTVKRIQKARELKIAEYNIINNINIGSIDTLLENVNFKKMSNAEPVVFHGDFILENILLDPKNKGEFLLIDWREDFGGDVDKGDIYYDLAKLKHNIYINHHNLEKNLFKLININNSSCFIDVKCNFILIDQIKSFEKFVTNNNLDNHKINILMSLIWINMAPLHDYPLNNFLFNFGKYNLYKYITEQNVNQTNL